MKVSVIIPTHNRADSVANAVRSALWQSYPNLEIIVVDDGSNDETDSALEPFSSTIRYVHQPQRGPSAARNAGAAIATGEFLAFLDSDDLWLPWHLSQQLALLAELGPQVPCCVGNAWITHPENGSTFTSFDDAGLKFFHSTAQLLNPLETLAGRFLLFNQTTTIRRAAFERVGGYDDSLWLLEDYDLAIKLARQSPWALTQNPSVVKPNHPDGIGVACMSNAKQHQNAKRHLLQRVLADPTFPPGTAKSLLRLAFHGVPLHHHSQRASASRAVHRIARLFAMPKIIAA